MKKYLFTLLLIAVVAVAGGVVYVSMPREETVADFDIYADDFSLVVNTEKQIKYSFSKNLSSVYVDVFEDDSTILTIEKRSNGAFFAKAFEIGSTTVTIFAKKGKAEATKIITISVVGDESEIVNPPEPPQNFEDVVNNLIECGVEGNTLNIKMGVEAMFSVSLGGITLSSVYIENTNSELIFEKIDIISFSTFSVSASHVGTFSIRCILNNSIVYNVSVVVTE